MSYICPNCQKTFSDKRYLTRHIESSVCTKKHICEDCQKEFSSAANLRQHNNRKNPCTPTNAPSADTSDTNKCIYCEKNFARPYSLRRHLEICPMKNNQTFLTNLVEKQQLQINQLLEAVKQPNITVNNTVNNNNNNNLQQNMYVNVKLCSFGKEDLSKLDPNKVLELLKGDVKDFIPKMIKLIHADPIYFNYHNIFRDVENDLIVIFDDDDDEELGIGWRPEDFLTVINIMVQQIKEHVRPGSGPYFDMTASIKDYETSNKIIEIATTDWDAAEFMEQTKDILAIIPKNKGFMDMVDYKK